MIKVLRIINRFNLGGPTYNVSYLTKHLPNEYNTLLIGGPEEEGEASSLHITNSIGVKPVILKELNRDISFFKDYRCYKEIQKIIQEFKPDIVHTHASKAGAVGRLAAIACKTPVIVHTFHGHVFHSYFGFLKTFIYKSIERYLAKRSNAIIAISNIQKNELVNEFKICQKNQTHVIPLGFDLQKFNMHASEKRKQFREQYNIKETDIVIGIIGRLAPIKNHELFFEAIDFVTKKSTKNIKAIVVGDGETKNQLITFLKEKNISYTFENTSNAKVQFIGWQKEVDVVLNGLDIVALSSKNEGTPVSLIEAQAAGKFIVTTNVGGVKDIINSGCGFITHSDSDFKLKLLEAVENIETLNTQAQLGIAYVNKHFSYQRLVNDMDLLYKQLLFKS